MANIYAANFGDVVKHCVLAEALTRERPTRYLESHAGRFDYALSDLDPGPGGVWDFVEASAGQADLGSSTYARAILDLVGQPGRPGRYPGSIDLADALLPPGVEIVAYELVSSSAANLVDRRSPTGCAVSPARHADSRTSGMPGWSATRPRVASPAVAS